MRLCIRGYKLPALSLMMAAVFSSAIAQAPATFAKVTIKKSTNSQQHTLYFNRRQLVATNVPLSSIIKFAYGFADDSPMLGAPAWMDSARYDIDASMDRPRAETTSGALDRTPIQTLLAERFHLVIHTVQQDVHGVAVGSSGGANGSETGTQTKLVTNLALRDNPPAIKARTFDEQCLQGQVPGGCYTDNPVSPVRTGSDATAGLTLVPVTRRMGVIVIDRVEKLAK